GRVVRHVEVVLSSRVLGAVVTVVAVLAAGCSGNTGRASRPEPTAIATTTTSIFRTTVVSKGCVVFSRGGPDGGIHVLAADGTLRRITTDPGDDQAAWSPDGTKIVFNRFTKGDQQIYVMHANGGDLTRITAGTSDASPTWSPDGSSIAFVGSGSPGRNLS